MLYVCMLYVGVIRHIKCCRSWWCRCSNPTGHVCSIWFCWSLDSAAATTVDLRDPLHCSSVVLIVSDRPEPVRASRTYDVIYYVSDMWRAAGVSARPSVICHVHHCRPDSADRKSWADAARVCGRYSSVWLMSSFWHQCAVDKHFSVCLRRCQLGEFKSTSAESRQNWSDVVCDCPASKPVTFLCLIVCRRPCRSDKICTGSGHSHRCRPVNADTCTKDGVTVLWCSASTASDLPICTDGHSTHAGCQAGSVTAWLWQCCAGRHSSLPGAPSAVGVERVSTAHLSAETLWPHYWRLGQSSLATSAGAYATQIRHADLQGFTRYCTAIPWTTQSSGWSTWSSVTTLCQHQSPGGAFVQTVYGW